MLLDWIAFLILAFFFVAPTVPAALAAMRGFVDSKHHGLMLAFVLVIPYVLVSLPLAQARPREFLNGLAVIAAVVLLVASLRLWRPLKAGPLHWTDLLVILLIWFPVEFDWLPLAEARIASGVKLPVSLLTVVDLAFLSFLVLRPLEGIGYSFRWRLADWIAAGQGLLIFLIIGVPLGLLTGFLTPSLGPGHFFVWVGALPLGYLFTALPEELLFRGLIQNMLEKRLGSRWLGLAVAAVIFGVAHINNATAGFTVPNYHYVMMATVAGIAYGWTWQKSGKITVAALVHAVVNYMWGIFFAG